MYNPTAKLPHNECILSYLILSTFSMQSNCHALSAYMCCVSNRVSKWLLLFWNIASGREFQSCLTVHTGVDNVGCFLMYVL